MKWKNYPIKEIDFKDKNYLKILKKVKNPPKKLFYRGNLSESLFKRSLAIVGSRRITRYGKEVIDRFVPGFVRQKTTIISGFMYGVDTQAHKKTVEYGGITIAVFGNGLNVLYPTENDDLYTEILESGGLVLSEYEPSAKPHLWTYVQRNRIVAGLSSLGVLVIEAGEKSGSLITAELARKQGKKVYAVPGPITSSISVGTNLLIKKGLAKMVTDPSDIFGKKQKVLKKAKPDGLSKMELEIYKVLENYALTIDEISRELDIDIVELNRVLSLMSLKGIVTESVGKFYLQNTH